MKKDLSITISSIILVHAATDVKLVTRTCQLTCSCQFAEAIIINHIRLRLAMSLLLNVAYN